MSIALGVDSLCWHMRLASGAITMERVLADAASLGAPVVTLNLHHVRERSVQQLVELHGRAQSLGLRLLAQGDFIGSPRLGDDVSVGITRVHEWAERAAALESPSLRLVSGFYRAELAGKPELIEAERRYVSEVLARASESARVVGVRLLLENHSDFTVDEYERIVRDVGRDRMGVFLDLINPARYVRRSDARDRTLSPVCVERAHSRLRAAFDPAARQLPPSRLRSLVPLSG